MNASEILKNNGIEIPEILLPQTNDLSTWSVIACDQYTQDKVYWENVAKATDGNPSTINLIFPEVFLDDKEPQKRISKIQNTMKEYISDSSNVFSSPFKTAIYLERKTQYGRTRKGLVVAIDLDSYDWNPKAKVPIRATEATIVERIPPRMKIRRGAPLELPHIMLLANDPKNLLIQEIAKQVKTKEPVYNSDLMLNAGHVTGWAVNTETEINQMASAIQELANAGKDSEENTFLFAVGDGNHSLATAKAVWDEYKKEHSNDKNIENHPARYALIEIVNLYDEGLTFEPIHRVLFNTPATKLCDYLQQKLGGKTIKCDSAKEVETLVSDKSITRFGFICENAFIVLESPSEKLAVSRLQPELDNFLKENTSSKIDYIHGTDEVLRLGKGKDTGLLLPPIDKDSFFSTIATGGPLPRKSFSMGESSEKRFYLECRKLF